MPACLSIISCNNTVYMYIRDAIRGAAMFDIKHPIKMNSSQILRYDTTVEFEGASHLFLIISLTSYMKFTTVEIFSNSPLNLS